MKQLSLALVWLNRGLRILASCSLLFTFSCKSDSNYNSVQNWNKPIYKAIRSAKSFEDLFERDTLLIKFPENDYLGIITDLLPFEDGSFWIADYQFGKSLLWYDSTGNFLKRVGERGDGPGEYQMPFLLRKTSNGKILVADYSKPRITIYDRKGNFIRTVNIDYVPAGLIPLDEDNFATYRADGIGISRPITIYSIYGKKIRNIGFRSKLVEQMLLKFALTTVNNYIVYAENSIYQIEYTHFMIRRFSLKGKLLGTFGVKPKQWRSISELNLNKYQSGGSIGRGRMREIDNFFRKELSRCSQVYWMHLLTPYILAVLYWNGKNSGFSKPFFYDFYSLDGKLIRSGLAVNYYPKILEDRTRMILLSYPDRLFGIEMLRERHIFNADARIIRYRLKSELILK